MPRRNLPQLYRDEFSNYNAGKFRQDLLAGLSVRAYAGIQRAERPDYSIRPISRLLSPVVALTRIDDR